MSEKEHAMEMDNFDKAMVYVLHNEGGFVDNPNDSGGATHFGVSLRFLREISPERLRQYGVFVPINIETIQSLTTEQAILIYRGEFWNQARFSEISDLTLATYIFDMAVSHGIAQAIKLVQRATWAIYRKRDYLRDDGVMGSKTLYVINELGDLLLPVIIASRASFYRLLVEKRPKDKEFLDGWLSRCYQI